MSRAAAIRALPLAVAADLTTTSHGRTRAGRTRHRARLPVIFPERAFADAGGLLSCGIDVPALRQRTGNEVGRIHRGAKPGGLPIGQPARFEPVVNLRTARMRGIAPSRSVPARAEEAIG